MPCLCLEKRNKHGAETAVGMKTAGKNHRRGLSGIGTEMACFAWSNTCDADVDHCASSWTGPRNNCQLRSFLAPASGVCLNVIEGDL